MMKGLLIGMVLAIAAAYWLNAQSRKGPADEGIAAGVLSALAGIVAAIQGAWYFVLVFWNHRFPF